MVEEARMKTPGYTISAFFGNPLPPPPLIKQEVCTNTELCGGISSLPNSTLEGNDVLLNEFIFTGNYTFLYQIRHFLQIYCTHSRLLSIVMFLCGLYHSSLTTTTYNDLCIYLVAIGCTLQLQLIKPHATMHINTGQIARGYVL